MDLPRDHKPYENEDQRNVHLWASAHPIGMPDHIRLLAGFFTEDSDGIPASKFYSWLRILLPRATAGFWHYSIFQLNGDPRILWADGPMPSIFTPYLTNNDLRPIHDTPTQIISHGHYMLFTLSGTALCFVIHLQPTNIMPAISQRQQSRGGTATTRASRKT
ncbi:hypothetical protein ARMGADRAFT_1033907 [Armillaria gallica]|uniref:Uncharacterized protein n=1 Tax=Armillaria gallica TaxID=47427 RepID=A0A2H3CZV3_ARMGA|nr:hypothetical protein ARMGADRAFT_1033907 [Armillaria gallica]